MLPPGCRTPERPGAGGGSAALRPPRPSTPAAHAGPSADGRPETRLSLTRSRAELHGMLALFF